MITYDADAVESKISLFIFLEDTFFWPTSEEETPPSYHLLKHNNGNKIEKKFKPVGPTMLTEWGKEE